MSLLKERIYETNAALGHEEKAYLLWIEDNKYLVLGVKASSCHSYQVGWTYHLGAYEVENSSYDIRKSDLYGTFLFDYFLNHFLQ